MAGPRPNTMLNPMAKEEEKKKDTEEEIEEETEEVESEEESEEEESEEESKDKSTKDKKSEDEEDEEEDEEDSESSSTDEDELDIDDELRKENRAAGKPDTKKAGEAFADRKKKKEKGTGDDKPLTQRDLDLALAADRKERQRDDALRLAQGMAGSDKEAELIVAKWSNRTFPKNLTLAQQIEEAYAITHSKKIIGERDEAMRALRGKQGIRRNVTGSEREGIHSGASEPKLPPADAASIRASGFVWSQKNRRYEKKLASGKLLVRDEKTKQVRLLRKGQ